MKGYACSNCGAKPKVKLKPHSMALMPCPVCGRLLAVKISETETVVISKVTA